jgi:hypothetical protein
MTRGQAEAEAMRRWGDDGWVQFRHAIGSSSRNLPGRLAPYRYRVGRGVAGRPGSIIGLGDSWLAAFADARAHVLSPLDAG